MLSLLFKIPAKGVNEKTVQLKQYGMALCHLQLAVITKDSSAEKHLREALENFSEVNHLKGVEVSLCMLKDYDNGLENKYFRAHSLVNEYDERMGLEKSVYRRRDPSKDEAISVLREVVLEGQGSKLRERLDLFPGYTDVVN